MREIKTSTRIKFAVARAAEHFLNIKMNREQLGKMIMKDLEGQQKGRKLEIKRVKSIDQAEFYRDHVMGGVPLIITDIAKE